MLKTLPFSSVGKTACLLSLCWSVTLLRTALAADPPTTEPAVDYLPTSGVVEVNKPIEWRLHALPNGPTTYRLKLNGREIIGEGVVPADGVVRAQLDRPGWLLAEFLQTQGGKPHVIRTAGAVAAPQQIRPAVEPPADFDAFWKDQCRQLTAVPPNATVHSAPSDRPGVDYFSVTLDNVDGRHVQGQLARPHGAGRYPAMIVYQWAGVYALQKAWVTGPAAEGWLVLNVSAHDLPIDRDQLFYEQQNAGALKNYVAIGATSRTTSYFRTMLLGDLQALTYLTTRPDWDGRTLIVRGASQGGLQSIAMAGLSDKVTALAVAVPAGCDTLGQDAGHQPGWPYWFALGDPADHPAIMKTSCYFDASNFALHVHCPALVGLGLRDTTAPAAGVLGMYNVLGGPKELVINPDAVHQTPQPRLDARMREWIQQQRTRTSGH